MKDFFISYHSSDQPWADWIIWVLEENNYSVIIQDESGQAVNLSSQLAEPTRTFRCIVSILSEAYLKSDQGRAEIAANYGHDTTTGMPRLLPIRVSPCDPQGPLNSIQYLDLVELSETDAEQTILQAITVNLDNKTLLSQVDLTSTADTAQAQSVSPTVEQKQTLIAKDNYAYSGQLNLRQHTQTVQGYLERLSDELGLEMMQIPAGSFLMGSPDSELERQDREGPQHEANLANFFMGKYPITQFQWRFVAELPSVNLRLTPNPARFEGDTHPVEQVSWLEAVEFCDRLSLHTGRPYRLPTEAEWEYACRANTTTPFHFGETITTDLANYNGADDRQGAYGRGPKGENRQTTTPVYQFGIANAFGLCDMHGNVWEWCQDPWRSAYSDNSLKRKIKAAPQLDQSTHRVARGGSWYTTPQRCRSASRIHFEPESRHADVGLRVVCSFEK